MARPALPCVWPAVINIMIAVFCFWLGSFSSSHVSYLRDSFTVSARPPEPLTDNVGVAGGRKADVSFELARQSTSLTANGVVTFESVGRQSKPVTDKISSHRYHFLYNELLPFSDKPLKLLEIGLGCGMGYGPGASAAIWPKLFPNAEIFFVEVDGECVKKWQSHIDELGIKIFVGSQHDVDFLKNIIVPEGPFDVIIDDGSHSDRSMLISLFTLLHADAVKPGGLYFVEDMLTNFESYGSYRDNDMQYLLDNPLLLPHELPSYLLSNPLLPGNSPRPITVFQMWMEQLASDYLFNGTFARKNFNYVGCGMGNCFIRMLTQEQKQNTYWAPGAGLKPGTIGTYSTPNY